MTISAKFYNPSNLSGVVVGAQAPVKLLFWSISSSRQSATQPASQGTQQLHRDICFSTINCRIHMAKTAGK